MACSSCGAIHSEVRKLNPACYTLPPEGGSIVSTQDMLITRNYFKEVTGSQASNSLIDSAIRSTSSRIEKYLGRRLLFRENHYQYVTGHGTTRVQLDLFPVYQVKFIGYPCCACESCGCCDDQYILSNSGQDGILISSSGFPLTAEKTINTLTADRLDANKYPGIIVVYSGGYITSGEYSEPENPDTDEECSCKSCMYLPKKERVHVLPDEIKFTVVKESLRQIQSINSPGCNENIKREKLDEYEVVFFSPAERQAGNISEGPTSGLSFESQEILRPYRLFY